MIRQAHQQFHKMDLTLDKANLCYRKCTFYVEFRHEDTSADRLWSYPHLFCSHNLCTSFTFAESLDTAYLSHAINTLVNIIAHNYYSLIGIPLASPFLFVVRILRTFSNFLDIYSCAGIAFLSVLLIGTTRKTRLHWCINVK